MLTSAHVQSSKDLLYNLLLYTINYRVKKSLKLVNNVFFLLLIYKPFKIFGFFFVKFSQSFLKLEDKKKEEGNCFIGFSFCGDFHERNLLIVISFII